MNINITPEGMKIENLGEDSNLLYKAGKSDMGESIVRAVTFKALNEEKIDPRYVDDYHISLRDLKIIVRNIMKE